MRRFTKLVEIDLYADGGAKRVGAAGECPGTGRVGSLHSWLKMTAIAISQSRAAAQPYTFRGAMLP